MSRGEIWTVSGGTGFAGKPRPAVLIQNELFETDSVTICGLTTDSSDAYLFRIRIEPSELNGLNALSWIMADKVTTVWRTKLGRRVGQLSVDDQLRLNMAIRTFLGLIP